MKIHLCKSNEKNRGGYHFCKQCGTKTMLIKAPDILMSVDQEPYTSGELIDDVSDDNERMAALGYEDEFPVEVELTGHWCPRCEKLSSICINAYLSDR